MGSEVDESNARIFGYQIQHIFPTQIFDAKNVTDEILAAKELLDSIGFNLEGRSNKIPLLINSTMRDAFLNEPASVDRIDPLFFIRKLG